MTRIFRSGWALVSLIALGCNGPGEWGTPEYFERIVGVKLTPGAPVVTCADDSGPGVLAFRRVQLPADVADKLREGAVLRGLPQQPSSEQQRKLQQWTHGALSEEARQAFELAVSGAATAIEHSRCRTLKSEQVVQQIRAALAKDTTWYSYGFKSADGRVASDDLEFRILDPIDRVLYELVNSS
jgi:hypothetical protein